MPNLSDGAIKILHHFRERKLPQMEYELPATLERIFSNPQECEEALEELEGFGYLTLGRAPPPHIPVASRVRAAALTLNGERFLQQLHA